MELREIIYPKDWTIIQIGKLCKTFTKQTGFDYSNHIKPTLVDKKTDKNVPFIQNKDFNGFKINYLTDYYVPLDVAVRFPMILLDERCLLISISGSIGKVGVFDNKNTAFIGGAIAVGKFHKPLYLDWVKHYLLSNDGQYKLLSKVKAGSHQNLILDDIRKISIPLPNETEQQAIANVLSDTDQLIQSLKTLISKKKDIKKGTMQELLTGKKRLQGFTEEWETKKLGNVGRTISGLSGKTKGDFDAGNARFITFMNVMSNVVIDTSILEKVNIKQGETQNTFKKGDLFFNTSSETPEEVGMCAVLLEDIGEVYLNSFCFGYRLNDEELDGLFLSYLINSNIGRSIFESLAQGATRYNLSKTNFNNVTLSVPKNINEQIVITQILSDIDAEIKALEQQLQKIQALKKGMMQELLTGRMRLVKPKTQEKTEPLAMVAEPAVVYKKKTKPKKHNEHINDAVLIGTMANVFGSDKFPLTRFMYTKVSYLLKRFKEEETLGYLKKAAGPYKPKTRYGGAEKIALQNQYVKKHISNYKGKKYENFLAGENVAEAINYFKDWYGENALQWIEQFKYVKRNQLELWTTVDMAIEDLKIEEKSVNFGTVKELINNHKEWRPKLKRPVFSDSNIEEAINKVNQLFL